jgi:cell division inhibitor SulA
MNLLNNRASMPTYADSTYAQSSTLAAIEADTKIAPCNYSTSKRVHFIDQPNFSYASNQAQYRDALAELLPTLASLKNSEGWITLINCPYLPNKETIKAAGIDPSHILLINTPATYAQQYNQKHLLACLSNGNSVACVLWQNESLTQWEQEALQSHCDQGNTHCFILNNTYKKGQLRLI